MKWIFALTILLSSSLFAQTPYYTVDSISLQTGESGSVRVMLADNDDDLYAIVAAVIFDTSVIVVDSVSVVGSIMYPYDEWRTYIVPSGMVSMLIIEDGYFTEHVYMNIRNGMLTTIYVQVKDFAPVGNSPIIAGSKEQEQIGIRPIDPLGGSSMFLELVPGAVTVISCCIGVRGNIDGDLSEEVNLADVITLADYMFNPADNKPGCLIEADLDGSGNMDISDLLWLVDYLFVPGAPELLGCGD